MLESRDKERILREAGYRYHFERSLYINTDKKKVFSVEAIDDHSVVWLRQKVAEPNPTSEWQFYFNTPPSEATTTSIIGSFE